jgi:hypothetical protein
MEEEYGCPKCQDSRHILQGGVWVRCSCLTELNASLKYSRAGLTFPPEELYLDNTAYFSSESANSRILAYTVALNKRLASDNLPSKAFCFSGTAISSKDFVVQCLLKTAVDAGLKVTQLSLDTLINVHFKNNKVKEDVEEFTMLDEFLRTDVLSLYFGSETQFRVGESYLTEIIRAHHLNSPKKVLILNTSLTYEGLATKYNDTFQSMFDEITPYSEVRTSRVIFMSIK